MAGDMGLYGSVAAIAGTVGAVVIALINRERSSGDAAATPPPQPLVPAAEEETEDADLTTVEGIARMLVRYGRRIRQLELAQAADRERIGAMSRYMHVLKQKIREMGGSVPEPDPRESHLIDQ